MKKKLLKTISIILCSVLVLLTAPVTLCVMGFSLPPQYGDTFMGELKYKYGRIKETEGKRIIVVGGSGVAFSLDSALIERELKDYKAVNFGMYAALGTSVMLDLSEKHVHSGDIVIVSPEQNEQTLSDYFNAEVMWQGLDGGFSMLKDVRVDKYGALLGRFAGFVADKYKYYKDGAAPSPGGVYSRAAFNDYGDIAFGLRDRNIMRGMFDTDMPVMFDEKVLGETFVDRLNAFAKKCEGKGASVYYRFCPTNASAVDDLTKLDGYYDILDSKLDFPIMGNPHNSVMEAEWFYDTNFHLNDSGVIVNTKRLIKDIKLVIGDSSPTDIDEPEMPEPEENITVDGDDTDVGLFVYECGGKTARIVAMTDEGKQRTSVVLPSKYNGLPVTSFAPFVFAGNPKIESVTVQRGIGKMQSGSFVGCTNLKRIVMTSPAPSDCIVSSDILVGTNANFYVPEKALSNYKTNYFWSRLSERIFPY